jgi:LysR family transcriptional regulator, nitrogen assimilation regulatory protein
MDLKQIKTFRAVAELGSLSKASDMLHIAQPALSRQILMLEHELKAPLFIRHGRGMVLTEAGRLFLDRTIHTVRELEQARDEVMSAAASGIPFGKVVIGMVPTVGSVLSSRLCEQVSKLLPGIKLRLVEAYGSYLTEWLHRGEIDLAAIYGPARAVHLSAETLRYDDLLIVAARGNGVADLATVDLDWLAKQPLVLPSRPHALRLLVDEALAASGLVANVVVEADSFGALIDIVAGGIGMTLLPYYAIARHDGVTVETVTLAPKLQRELVLATPPIHRLSRATRAVLEIVRTEALALADSKLPNVDSGSETATVDIPAT